MSKGLDSLKHIVVLMMENRSFDHMLGGLSLVRENGRKKYPDINGRSIKRALVENTVPFYFQPTLGGSDINGNPSLASYQDYRFRAPDVMLFRESFEHSLGNLPIGFAFMADEGKVAMTRGEFGSSPWLHSFSTGLTLRAGGFPQVYLLFAWGGKEGTHTIASVNTTLLGGSNRPSLY
jgi:hypothetical protein